MAREWTQRHIEELIEQVAIREGYDGGGGNLSMNEMTELVMEKYVYGTPRDFFVAAAGASPTGVITRLSRSRFRLQINMSYGSVSTGDTLVYIPLETNISDASSPLFLPSYITFLNPGFTAEIIEEDFGSFDRSYFQVSHRGTNTGKLTGNNLTRELNTTVARGLYIEATQNFSFNNLDPFKIDITIMMRAMGER